MSKIEWRGNNAYVGGIQIGYASPGDAWRLFRTEVLCSGNDTRTGLATYLRSEMKMRSAPIVRPWSIIGCSRS